MGEVDPRTGQIRLFLLDALLLRQDTCSADFKLEIAFFTSFWACS